MSVNFYPVILAGGRGTRFWPLSRKKCAKQLLALDGKRTMIQNTVARLAPLALPKRFWIITNEDLRDGIVCQLPKLEKKQVIAEPVGRNTAPAIGLAAFILLRSDPDAVLGLFPSDQVVADADGFRRNIERAVQIAAAGPNIVTLGIKPTRPETGYGYIETGAAVGSTQAGEEIGAIRVRRFTEKPDVVHARRFVEAGNYFWNSGIFIWGARTLADALREHLPKTVPYLEEIAAAYGPRKFDATFRRLYPKCENISVDYALLEPRSAKGEQQSNIFCIPTDVGWNDLGSWTALYEHRTRDQQDPTINVIEAEKSFELNASGNYVYAPGKFVATVGVSDIVVVETEDALLITTRANSQDVGKIVKHLDEKNLKKLV
jgi:mannose-1-phosphate guanylyltransferase